MAEDRKGATCSIDEHGLMLLRKTRELMKRLYPDVDPETLTPSLKRLYSAEYARMIGVVAEMEEITAKYRKGG